MVELSVSLESTGRETNKVGSVEKYIVEYLLLQE